MNCCSEKIVGIKKRPEYLLMPSIFYGKGFTLIEMMVVVAIIVILVSMMVGIAKRIDDQGKERLCRDTIALIGNALEQFRDFGYEYKDAGYLEFTFPLDCNDDSAAMRNVLIPTLEKALGLTAGAITIFSGTNEYEYSGSEALYFFLRQVPDSRATLDKIDKSLVTNKDKSGGDLILRIGTVNYPFMRFIDPWGTTLRYDYYNEVVPPSYPNPDTRKTFPVITSAGPDKTFGTNDDISNIQQK
jgi:prepilin-type N-terminal cleavage/methylation domain-containing protein